MSFDVWGTLLNLTKAYSLIAQRLAEELNTEQENVLEALKRGAKLARRSRRSEGWFDAKRGAEIVAREVGITVDLLFSVVESVLVGSARELLLPGAREAVEGVKSLGFRVGILGNVLFWPGRVTRRVLEAAGLAGFFDAILFSDEIGAAKPDVRAFKAIAEALGVDTSRLVHVGDRVDEDVAGVILAGGYGVLVWAPINEEFYCIHARLCGVRSVASVSVVVSRIARE
ncbi:HAD-superfamily hydrolase, subfamily IA, variant 1 [Pyrolobus fumarii 1A]|uniref:HAD-superfamily hydrolase, subfamily IA, variant 1 n=1 Tax=Pyrolobus fumarii (strain DSM 11204 / 1A) TaxID=694429 RepID=G0ECM3_PYRF1|nr:HAD-superfamily hydrolase, subfamily IA, variant 1 [Pyrolobus fumarii 1A]